MMLVLLLLSIVPNDTIARETFDRVEVNAYYDDMGRLVFDQHLFYSWDESNCRFQLQAWRMVKGNQQNPRHNPVTNLWELHWNDGDVERSIQAPVLMRTVTQYDPELTERDFLPKEKRRELMNPKVLLKRK